jgi:hypothetical protein
MARILQIISKGTNGGRNSGGSFKLVTSQGSLLEFAQPL